MGPTTAAGKALLEELDQELTPSVDHEHDDIIAAIEREAVDAWLARLASDDEVWVLVHGVRAILHVVPPPDDKEGA